MNNEHNQNQVKEMLRKRKKARRVKKLRVFLVFFVLALILAYFVTDVSKIKSIDVKGNNYVDKQELLTASKVYINQSYTLFTSTSDIEGYINEVKGVESATVTKSLFGEIVITVDESEIIGHQIIDSNYYILNTKGEVYQTDSDVAKQHSLTTALLHNFDESSLQAFATEFARVPSQVEQIVSDVFLAPQPGDPTRVELHLDNGIIFIVRIEDMASQLAGDNVTTLQNDYPEGKIFDLNGKYSYITE